MLILGMIAVLPALGKYKYNTWRKLPVKCYIDNFVCLQSCIRNVNSQHTHEEEESAGSQLEIASCHQKTRSQTSWPTDVMSVGEVNNEGLALDMRVNTRLSRVCGLPAWQRVSLTLQGFDELAKNEKDELFENSFHAYAQYLEELKQKGKKLAMKIISHAWRSYKSKLVKIWRN
jgi:hypothetical protein